MMKEIPRKKIKAHRLYSTPLSFVSFLLLLFSLNQNVNAKNIIVDQTSQKTLSIFLTPNDLAGNSLSMIEENRQIHTEPKDDVIQIKGLSSQMNANSLQVKIGNNIQQLTIKKHAADKTLDNLHAELQPYIGSNITVKYSYTHKKAVKHSVVLLKIANNTAVIKHNNTIKPLSLTDPNISISLPTKPIESPTTPMTVSFKPNRDRNDNIMNIRYLTTGIAWETDFSLQLNEKDAHFTGAITVTNHTNTIFRNSQITLLADNVNTRSANPKHLINNMIKNSQIKLTNKVLKLPETITLLPGQTTNLSIQNLKKLPINTYFQYLASIQSNESLKRNQNINNRKDIYPRFTLSILNNKPVFIPKKSNIAVYQGNQDGEKKLMIDGVFIKREHRNEKTLSLENSQIITVQQTQTSYKQTFDGEIIGLQFKIKNSSALSQNMRLTTQFDHPAKIISSTYRPTSKSDLNKNWLFPVQGNSTTIFNLQVRLFTN